MKLSEIGGADAGTSRLKLSQIPDARQDTLTELPTPAPAQGGGPVGKASRAGAESIWGNLLAGAQGVKTEAQQTGKLAPESEQWLFAETNKVRDPAKYYAAPQPETGKMGVYEKTPESNVGLWDRLVQFGRSFGVGAQPEHFPPTTRPTTQQQQMNAGMMSGGPPAPSPAQQRLQDFEQAGVTPSMPAVGQGRASGLAANLGRTLPFSPISKGIEQAAGETAQGIEQMAGRFGQAQTPEQAGSVARNALNRFAADNSGARRDYDEFHRMMLSAPPIPVDKTLGALRELFRKYPSAPELEGMFAAPKLRQLLSGLEPTTRTIPERVSPILGESGQPIVTSPAREVKTGGSLTTPELRDLTSQVGRQLESTSFGPESIPKSELKRVYGALKSDMQAAAQRQGPAAMAALTKANINYGVRMRTLERLEPLIRGESPEATAARINRAAQSSGGADVRLLDAAKRVMNKEEWGDIGAATLRNLGNATPGQAPTSEFSIASFSTNWNKLSPRAKDLLFGKNEPESVRDGLEALARVARHQKDVGRLANPTHSGEMVAIARVVEGVLVGLAAGHLPLGMVAGGVVAPYGAAKLMMSPGFTRWMYRMPSDVAKSPDLGSAISRAGNNLRTIMQGGNPYRQEEAHEQMTSKEPLRNYYAGRGYQMP